jgi:hypothetical protein
MKELILTEHQPDFISFNRIPDVLCHLGTEIVVASDWGLHVVARAERDESGELEFVGAVMDTTKSKRERKKSARDCARPKRISHASIG